MIPPDFYNAHVRHWNDANLLFETSRWANADQLYGYSAECGLKCLMLRFGMVMNQSTGKPKEKEDQKHINNIWIRYETYRMGRSAADYALPQVNPFDNWDISLRYAHDSHFTQSRVEQHQQGAGGLYMTW